MEGIGDLILPHSYQNTRGREAKDTETMLRMFLMQARFNLSVGETEDAIRDSYAAKIYMKI